MLSSLVMKILGTVPYVVGDINIWKHPFTSVPYLQQIFFYQFLCDTKSFWILYFKNSVEKPC